MMNSKNWEVELDLEMYWKCIISVVIKILHTHTYNIIYIFKVFIAECKLSSQTNFRFPKFVYVDLKVSPNIRNTPCTLRMGKEF